MIKQEGADTVLWDSTTLIPGQLSSLPMQTGIGRAFVLVPVASDADSVMAADRLKGLVGFGAGALAVIFLVLLAIPFLLRKSH